MNSFLLIEPNDETFINQLADSLVDRIIVKITPILSKTNPIKQDKVYLTRKRAAEKLLVTPQTLDRYVQEGLIKKLGAGKPSRYHEEEIQLFYEN